MSGNEQNTNTNTNPVIKLVIGWVLFIVALLVFIFVIKPMNKKDNGLDNIKVEKNEESSTEGVSIVPMETDAYPELNQFITTFLNATTACDQQALQSMVTDPAVYDDMSTLQSRAKFLIEYNNIKCYTKKGPADNTFIVFVVTNTVLKDINTAPMDFMTFYVIQNESGYVINNGALSEEENNYIATIKKDADIQEIMKKISVYNDQAVENDEGLKAFYDMLGK
ncbi:MAG: hypothetical protein IKQ71_00120 [Lachnospiraceae bacterium]|nr:hypothetical protein [Lachnospiraceae bacterium]